MSFIAPPGVAPTLPRAPRSGSALRETAAHAEALLFETLLKSADSARLGPPDAGSDSEEDSAGEGAFREMRAALSAEALARAQPLGLADALASPVHGLQPASLAPPVSAGAGGGR